MGDRWKWAPVFNLASLYLIVFGVVVCTVIWNTPHPLRLGGL